MRAPWADYTICAEIEDLSGGALTGLNPPTHARFTLEQESCITFFVGNPLAPPLEFLCGNDVTLVSAAWETKLTCISCPE